jgi:hypothetical protein
VTRTEPYFGLRVDFEKEEGIFAKGAMQARSGSFMRPIRRSVKAGDVTSFFGLDISQES